MSQLRRRVFNEPGISDKTWPDGGPASLAEFMGLGWRNWNTAAFPDGSEPMTADLYGVYSGGVYMRNASVGGPPPYAYAAEYIPNGGVAAINNAERINDCWFLLDYSLSPAARNGVRYGLDLDFYDATTGVVFTWLYAEIHVGMNFVPGPSEEVINIGENIGGNFLGSLGLTDPADVFTNRILLRFNRVNSNNRLLTVWMWDRNAGALATDSRNINVAGIGDVPIFCGFGCYTTAVLPRRSIMRVNEVRVSSSPIAYGAYGGILT